MSTLDLKPYVGTRVSITTRGLILYGAAGTLTLSSVEDGLITRRMPKGAPAIRLPAAEVISVEMFLDPCEHDCCSSS